MLRDVITQYLKVHLGDDNVYSFFVKRKSLFLLS